MQSSPCKRELKNAMYASHMLEMISAMIRGGDTITRVGHVSSASFLSRQFCGVRRVCGSPRSSLHFWGSSVKLVSSARLETSLFVKRDKN